MRPRSLVLVARKCYERLANSARPKQDAQGRPLPARTRRGRAPKPSGAGAQGLGGRASRRVLSVKARNGPAL